MGNDGLHIIRHAYHVELPVLCFLCNVWISEGVICFFCLFLKTETGRPHRPQQQFECIIDINCGLTGTQKIRNLQSYPMIHRK